MVEAVVWITNSKNRKLRSLMIPKNICHWSWTICESFVIEYHILYLFSAPLVPSYTVYPIHRVAYFTFVSITACFVSNTTCWRSHVLRQASKRYFLNEAEISFWFVPHNLNRSRMRAVPRSDVRPVFVIWKLTIRNPT